MALKKGTRVKKAVKKILDKTTVDEKVIGHVNKNKGLYNTILCYTKCYGGYLLAVGAGCTFGINIWIGLGLLVAAGTWGWLSTCGCKLCKGGDGSCCK
tara:strand:- start:89 stop:382 length:294 start_codon:yes stop_codon:yes gene_type:complete